jgi:hypothetical protein
MTDASTRLDQAHKRAERADHQLRIYTAVVVTVTALLLITGFAVDYANRTKTRQTIVECVTPDTPCNNEIQAGNAEQTNEQIQLLIDSITSNSDDESNKIQDKLDQVLELLRSR